MTNNTLNNTMNAMNGMRNVAANFATNMAKGRASRMTTLLVAVVVLSLVDLVMTLHQMQTSGMAEGNPLVMALVRLTHSSLAVGVYKMMTVALCVGVLHMLRRTFSAELAAWAAVIVLSVLTVQWMRYNAYMGSLEPTTVTAMANVDSDWTRIN